MLAALAPLFAASFDSAVLYACLRHTPCQRCRRCRHVDFSRRLFSALDITDADTGYYYMKLTYAALHTIRARYYAEMLQY